MLKEILSLFAGLALIGTMAACGAGSSLTTGSLVGGSSSSQPPAPKPVTSTDRALYVATNVARAQRCGYYFDPEQVRTSFLAAEQQAGTPPDQMQKVTREFDFTRQTVLNAIVKDEGYCTEGRNREVKAALTRQLAGDFNPPRARSEVNIGLFDHRKKDAEFDGNKVFEPARGRPGILSGEN